MHATCNITILALFLLYAVTLAQVKVVEPGIDAAVTPEETVEGMLDEFPEGTAEFSDVTDGEVTEEAAVPVTVDPDGGVGSEIVQEEAGVCVDERYLRGLGHGGEDFVHRGGLIARVFCPGNGLPCGTGFHKVRVGGVGMSYVEFCAMVRCERRVMRVNSVYSHRWRERSVGGVVVTMYDVRHLETAQRALHWGMEVLRGVVGR